MSNAIMMQEAPKKDRFSNSSHCQRGSNDALPVGPSVRYYFDPCFLDISRRDQLLGPMPEGENEPRRAPPGMPSYFAHLWAVPLLDRQQESHCFRKLNLLKHLAAEQLGGQALLEDDVQPQIALPRLQSLITKNPQAPRSGRRNRARTP